MSSPTKKKIRITLVEVVAGVLVVILAGVSIYLVVNYNQALARDAQREADLAQIRQALEAYRVDRGSFPKRDSGARLEEDLGLEDELREYLPGGIPRDPLYPQTYFLGGAMETYTYFYKTKDNGSEYRVFASRETGEGNFISIHSEDGHDIAWTGSRPQEVVIQNCDHPFISSDSNQIQVSISQNIRTAGQAANYISIKGDGHQASVFGELGVIDLLTANEIRLDINQSEPGEKVLGFFSQSSFLSSGEDRARAIDEDDEYVYIGLDTSPAKIIRIDRGDFSRAETKTLAVGEDKIASLVNDDNYIYVGLKTTPGKIVRLSKSDFVTTRTIALDSGQNIVSSLTQDEDYLYIGLGTGSAQIIRLDKSNLTTSVLSLQASANRVISLINDSENVYAVLDTSPTQIVKVNKQNQSLARGSLTVGEDSAYGVTQDESFLYLFLSTRPARMVRVSKQDFTAVAKIIPATGRGISQDQNFIYLVSDTSPAQVTRIDKETLLMTTVSLAPGDHPAYDLVGQGQHLFLAFDTEPAKIIRLNKAIFDDSDLERYRLLKEFIASADNPVRIINDRDYLYIGLSASPSIIARADKKDFSSVFYKTLPKGFDALADLTQDEQYLYGTFSARPGYVAKIDKSDFSVISNSFQGYQVAKIIADQNYLYVGYSHRPGGVLKIDKSDLSEVGATDFPRNIDSIGSLTQDENYLYVSLDTQPIRILRINKEDLNSVETKELETGGAKVVDLAQDEKFIYAGLVGRPGTIVRIDKRDFSNTLVKTLFVNEDSPASLLELDESVYICLGTSPAKLVRLDKDSFATTTTKTLAAGEDVCQSMTVDQNYFYLLLKTKPAQIVRVLDLDLVPDVQEADTFEMHSFDVSNLSAEQRSKGRYDKIIFNSYHHSSQFSFYLDNIRYSR